MRRQTELFANLRGMCFSQAGWGDKIHDGSLQGGSGKMLPSALAVLAAAEAGFMFLLIKLSGIKLVAEGGPVRGEDNEHETCSANVIGSNSGAEQGRSGAAEAPG